MSRRVGVLGGTFDPPHVGHLVIAEWARVRLGLDRVVLVPAGTPPHKRRTRLTPAKHRLEMTRLAVRGHAAFTVSDLEARRAGPSYTVDTLRALHRAERGARLFLVVGEDWAGRLGTWREPEAIRRLATLVIAARPGGRSVGRLPRGVVRLGNPRIEIASRQLRRRARAGESLRVLVPDPVIAYIRRHRLYGAGS